MIGSYILVFYINKNCKIQIGKLGVINFRKGYYLYIGSAFGRHTSLEKRISRHLRLNQTRKGPLRWHVDYLLSNKKAPLINSVILKSNSRNECIIAAKVRNMADGFIPNYGSTDCNLCPSHLYYFNRYPRLLKITGLRF